MGAMLALSGIYPAICHSNDVFGAYEFRKKELIFSDVLILFLPEPVKWLNVMV